MADPTLQPVDATRPPSAAPPGMPLWVKAFGVAFLLLVLVFGGLHLAGRGMGPMSHVPPVGGR